MANSPEIVLDFTGACGDCGTRTVSLPAELPPMGDDFNWQTRDFNDFRRTMLEELQARFPQRRRWTSADLEVVIVEAFAVVLDQFSDQLDRAHAEAFLESARNPHSVRRLLAMIGYDALAKAPREASIPESLPFRSETDTQRLQRLTKFLPGLRKYRHSWADPVQPWFAGIEAFLASAASADNTTLDAVQSFLDETPIFVQRARQDALARYWRLHPVQMNYARSEGPLSIHEQQRIVTLKDFDRQLSRHPLVLRASAGSKWTGSWRTVEATVLLLRHMRLDSDSPEDVLDERLLLSIQEQTDDLYKEHGVLLPDWTRRPNARAILRPWLDRLRMAGTEVWLSDAELVGINISISVRVNANYFQTEVRQAVEAALDSGAGGFFEPGGLRFGGDLYGSDIIETVMRLDGVDAVCLNRFKRVGKRFANRADEGRIILSGVQVPVIDHQQGRVAAGYLRVSTHGGLRG